MNRSKGETILITVRKKDLIAFLNRSKGDHLTRFIHIFADFEDDDDVVIHITKPERAR